MERFKDTRRSWFSSKLYAFLKPYKVTVGENLLSLQGGSFFLPDDKRDSFYELYANEYSRYNFTLVERRSNVFPFLIDFDGVPKSLQNDDFWVRALECAFKVLNESALDAGDAEVQIRNGNRHIMFPSCLVTEEQAVRATELLQKELYTAYPEQNWRKIVDPSVVGPNGLRMLGSYKCWKHADLLKKHKEWSRRYFQIDEAGKCTRNIGQKARGGMLFPDPLPARMHDMFSVKCTDD